MTGLYYLKKYAKNASPKRLEEGIAHLSDSARYNRYFWDWGAYGAGAVDAAVKYGPQYYVHTTGPKLTDKIPNKRKTTMSPKTPVKKVKFKHISGLTRGKPFMSRLFPGKKVGRRRIRKSRRSRRPVTERDPIVKLGKRLRTKHTPNVKVSKRLRAQVKKVINGRQFHGFYRRFMVDSLNLAGASHDSQMVYAGGSGVRSSFCTPAQIWDAFSVLWNNKARATDQFAIIGNFGVNAAGTAQTNNFKGEVTKITRTYTIRNNTHVAWKIALYDCLSKRASVKRTTDGCEAYDDWVLGLANETPPVSQLSQTGANIFGQAIDTIGTTPTQLPSFRHNWKTSVTYVTIQPGETYNYKMSQGAFTFSQRINATAGSSTVTLYNTIPGITRNLIFICQPEVEFDATNGAIGQFIPRAQAYAPAAGAVAQVDNYNPNVLITYVDKYYLVCPEQTKDVIPALDGNAAALQLSQQSLKQDVFAFWNNLGSPGANTDLVGRMEVEAPATGSGHSGL